MALSQILGSSLALISAAADTGSSPVPATKKEGSQSLPFLLYAI